MNVAPRWISAGALVLTTGCAFASPELTQIIKPKSQPKASPTHQAAQRQALTVLVRDLNGEQLGSGVFVARAAAGRWLATNQHVVKNRTAVCVVTSDQRSASALAFPQRKEKGKGFLDLALIWLPVHETTPAVVAAIKEEPYTAKDLPLVVATGFPTPLDRPVGGPQYTERPGLLLPLLRLPLQEGLDLTYSANVEKGMSGGGVFLDDELIGINSAHRNPLWPGQWRDGDGRVVDQMLNQKLDLVSLGISAKHIKNAVLSTNQPTLQDLRKLIDHDCSANKQ